jgi:hypothetical protein
MLEKLPEGLGRALVNQRAGMEKIVYNQLHGKGGAARLNVSSSAFEFNGRLPTRYTADGEGISPPLAWNNFPADLASFAVIVEDPDSPTPHPLVHAIVVDIPIEDRSLAEGALNSQRHEHENVGLEVGSNSFFEHGWLPPDPPPGHGEHRYVFQVFALPPGTSFSKTVGRREFINVVLDRAVAAGCLIGTYERASRPETVSATALASNPSVA